MIRHSIKCRTSAHWHPRTRDHILLLQSRAQSRRKQFFRWQTHSRARRRAYTKCEPRAVTPSVRWIKFKFICSVRSVWGGWLKRGQNVKKKCKETSTELQPRRVILCKAASSLTWGIGKWVAYWMWRGCSYSWGKAGSMPLSLQLALLSCSAAGFSGEGLPLDSQCIVGENICRAERRLELVSCG